MSAEPLLDRASVAEPKKKTSGTSRTYAERKAKGRPNVTISITDETLQLLAELSEHYGLSRSAVIDLSVRELSKKRNA